MRHHPLRVALIAAAALVLAPLAPPSAAAPGSPRLAPAPFAQAACPAFTNPVSTLAQTPSASTPANTRVSTARGLQQALDQARPGHVIELADGEYQGEFTITVSGEPSKPITLRGSRNATLRGNGIRNGNGYALRLEANYWVFQGFAVTNGLKGIVALGASFNVFDSLLIHNVGQQGIHLRSFSTNNTIQRTTIRDTGRYSDKAKYGEGVYIGSEDSEWKSPSLPDTSDRNRVIQNVIGPGVTAESIDVKEGTSGGLIADNCFDGTGVVYDDMPGERNKGAFSWVDVKGSFYLVEHNNGVHTKKHGFHTRIVTVTDDSKPDKPKTTWGQFNTFAANTIALPGGPGLYGVYENDKGAGTVIYNDNIVTINGARSGESITNGALIKLSPCPSVSSSPPVANAVARIFLPVVQLGRCQAGG